MRLSLADLDRLSRSGDVRVPELDVRAITAGIVHLGIGAFHRAHQALYTQDAMVAGGRLDWGIVGVTGRSDAVRDQLVAQDCLYTALERGPGAAPPRIGAAVRSVVSSVDTEADVPGLIGDPRTRVVTLSVTEKGYRRTPGGELDLRDPVVRADLAGGSPHSVIGRLVAGLRRRADTHGQGVTVLCCDNLAHNGPAVRRLVADYCAALPRHIDPWEWIESSVTFPACMVDRIVPSATAGDLTAVAAVLGVRDEAAVVAEPFSQWVIEDSFAAGRPSWEAAGAVFTHDVTPYETAKLRLLNGTHSLLAYTGALAGHDTIAQAIADPDLASAAAALMAEDVAPTLSVPDGFDVAGYCRTVLERFANPALRHRTVQVASDGSQKIPIRLLGTARERLAAGGEPRWVALAVAAWLLYVGRGQDRHGRALPLDDPLAPRLAVALRVADSPAALVDAGLAVSEVFPADLAADVTFRGLLIDAVRRCSALGSRPSR